MINARLGVAVIAALFCFGTARAADLPSVKGPPVFLPPPPVFSWTGFYAGVNLGYGFGNNDPTYGAHNFILAPPAPVIQGAFWVGQTNLSGVVGGGQVGYNYQFNPWLVVGVEADIQGADLRSSSLSYTNIDPPPPAFHYGVAYARQNVDWFGTVRGRIGFTPFNPQLLLYATGGFAYGGVRNVFQYADIFPTVPSVLFGGSYRDSTKTGWTVGGGVEYAPIEFPNWSLKAEYLYVDLGRTYLSAAGAGIFQVGPVTTINPPRPGFFSAAQDPSTRFHVVRIGLNYHFNIAAPPVVAKY